MSGVASRRRKFQETKSANVVSDTASAEASPKKPKTDSPAHLSNAVEANDLGSVQTKGETETDQGKESGGNDVMSQQVTHSKPAGGTVRERAARRHSANVGASQVVPAATSQNGTDVSGSDGNRGSSSVGSEKKEKSKKKPKKDKKPKTPAEKEFKDQIAEIVVGRLSKYYKSERITTKDDFKHFSRTITKHIFNKERSKERARPPLPSSTKKKIVKFIDSYFERHTLYSRSQSLE
eukprot:GFYU01020193.1.p1 GENE.GFYU01020193.1~~GFYU01020193.1.p1  ORF type:complete len:236 (-),score=24.04 GFYU01020193.1:165-872(-)